MSLYPAMLTDSDFTSHVSLKPVTEAFSNERTVNKNQLEEICNVLISLNLQSRYKKLIILQYNKLN